jgi:uncharacterized protein
MAPVIHEGNQSSSPEEANRVRELVTEILNSGTTWIDRNGTEQPVTLDDILIIAPTTPGLRAAGTAARSSNWDRR